ncbi:helix-turn-helix domain-containing protein [Autumnicola musiva]|uniref:Helix-turn-helix transcriptional regulator n=1 Tax=Autumnicola musiva TaxID=3075589 RepID=A0ABU3D7F2_9FLAO|nr:helix-turn-helix transcriptional regulator [Zunongwangia sp. F117]MDT0677299.1 helix-turn-helix transcriptional regulator [Zunongwangia sp. F117]
MKIGDNIQEIREREKNYKRSYMASCLGISTRAYCNIENNITDITLTRLAQISDILDCDPLYILRYKEIKDDFITNLRNHDKPATNTVKSK